MNAVSFLQIFYGPVLSQAINMSRNMSRNELKLTLRSSGSQIKASLSQGLAEVVAVYQKELFPSPLAMGLQSAHPGPSHLSSALLVTHPPLLCQAVPHSSPPLQRFFFHWALSSYQSFSCYFVSQVALVMFSLSLSLSLFWIPLDALGYFLSFAYSISLLLRHTMEQLCW